MPYYAKKIIYKIVNYDLPEYVYVGHTTNMTERKAHHNDSCYTSKDKLYTSNTKLYTTIRANGEWADWKFIIIKNFPCENRREAEFEEDIIMMEYNCSINSIRACRSHNQREIDNKQKLLYYKKQYREINQESIRNKNMAYVEKKKEYILSEQRKISYTCKCGSYICLNRKNRHELTQKHINFIESFKL